MNTTKMTWRDKHTFVYFLSMIICLGFIMVQTGNAYAAPPALLFSDLDSGPNTGWAGSTTQGVAVSIWGENFGSVASSSYVTINGANILSTDSVNMAEWNASGPARNLSRITFWVPSSAASGAGTISVTINGVTSNTLPFTIRSGNIYFIAVADGNDSYNGKYPTRTGHSGSDGPWQNLHQASPSNNTTLKPGDSVYVRGSGGTYTTLDDQQMFIHQRSGSSGTAGNPFALVGYPGETVTVDGTNASRGFNYPEGAVASYWTYAKFNFVNGYEAHSVIGNYNRVIGNSFQNMLQSAWTGVIWVSDAQYTSIYGNYWNNDGFDKYKHLIYAKTQPFTCSGSSPGADVGVQYLYIGWNEFSNYVSSDGYGGSVFLSKSSDSCVSSLSTQYIYIHDNYFHDGVGDFIYTGDGTYQVQNISIYNNIFKGGTVSGHGTVYFEIGTGPGESLYNNTFYQTGSGAASVVNISGQGSSQVAVTMKNNIFYTLSNQTILATGGGAGGTLNSTNDLFYNPGGTTIVPSGTGITVTNAKTGNPLFNNPGSGDFTLQSSSPAIDAGVSTSPLVTQDYVGTARPQGSEYDIGAYEYGTGSPAPTTHTVTPSAGANGGISPNAIQSVVDGNTTTFTVTPNANYTATVGGTCGGYLSGTMYTTNPITADCTVTATFSGTTITHTVTPSAGANGGISPNTAQTVVDGSTTIFTVTPNANYVASMGGSCGGTLSGTTYTTNAITADCTVTANFTATPTYTIGGSITNLAGTISLTDANAGTASVSSSSFVLPNRLLTGTQYNVTVATQPASRFCTVSNGSGTVNGANVTNVSVSCANTYTVGGTLSGFSGNGTVTIQNNGSDTLHLSSNGAFTFTSGLLNGAAYLVTVTGQPTGQTCTVSNGAGSISGANITNITISCANTGSTGKTPSTVQTFTVN